jgi:hypothetical protein
VLREFVEMANGLSTTISTLKKDVAKLRANVLVSVLRNGCCNLLDDSILQTTSEAERKRLYELGRLPSRPLSRQKYSTRAHSFDECTLMNLRKYNYTF